MNLLKLIFQNQMLIEFQVEFSLTRFEKCASLNWTHETFNLGQTSVWFDLEDGQDIQYMYQL